jgi:hypothetical protein
MSQKNSAMRPGCPPCAARNALTQYRCQVCLRTFNALTNTPLRHKGQWLTYAETLRNGAGAREAARRCGVDRTTTFRWRHRFLPPPRRDQAEPIVRPFALGSGIHHEAVNLASEQHVRGGIFRIQTANAMTAA